MRYLAIFELMLVSLGLICFSLYLFFADTDQDISEDYLSKSIEKGQFDTVSLVVVQKYSTDGKQDRHYVMFSPGKDKSEQTRLVSSKVYKNINIGDQYIGYVLDNDYLMPDFDNPHTQDAWKLYAGCLALFFAFAGCLASYKIFKRQRVKEILMFDRKYRLSGF